MSRARDLADGNFSGDLEADSPTFVVDSANNRVGVGTASPAGPLEISNGTERHRVAFGTNEVYLMARDASAYITQEYIANQHVFTGYGDNSSNEACRIDSSGHLLFAKTSTSSGVAGIRFAGDAPGYAEFTRDGGNPLYLNRETSNGDVIRFAKDDSFVGSMGTDTSGTFGIHGAGSGNDAVGFLFVQSSVNPRIIPCQEDFTGNDAVVSLGNTGQRFNDIYAYNGTIQTSDRNEKQDIEELTDAEQRVAVAAKGLLRKYRWKDAVAEKGDEARIHFGIIAQDLQAAFAAEGLDAGRYGMFISSTWWEADRVIPAVEAQDAVYETQVDEDGNEVQVLVSAAREAQPERVVTDTFETLEEAPEGAVQRTRMGVRYPELLAFIIAAL